VRKALTYLYGHYFFQTNAHQTDTMNRISKMLTLAAVAVASSFSAFAQTAEEVVAKSVTAIGGADAWRKVTTMKMTGAVNAQGMEIPVTITQEHMKGFRMDITVMGMNGYQIITPTAGWSFMPFGNGQTAPEPMTAEQVKMAADQLDLQSDFVDYAKKGSTIELQGKEDVEGTECWKVRLVKKSGTETVYYIDPATNFIVRSVTKVKVDGKDEEAIVNYSNYQPVAGAGVTMPMTIDQGMGPVEIKTVEVNKPVEAKTFQPS